MQQIKISEEDFTRVNNDTYGNPRYVIHFLNLIPSDFEFIGVSQKYDLVLSINKKLGLGGRKFHNKQYGGGLVFQSYNLTHTIKFLEEKLNKHFGGVAK